MIISIVKTRGRCTGCNKIRDTYITDQIRSGEVSIENTIGVICILFLISFYTNFNTEFHRVDSKP